MNYIISEQLLPDRLYCQNNCGRYYVGKNRKSNLKRHLTYQCGVDPKFGCRMCQKRFTNKHSMKMHALNIHHIVDF